MINITTSHYIFRRKDIDPIWQSCYICDKCNEEIFFFEKSMEKCWRCKHPLPKLATLLGNLACRIEYHFDKNLEM